MPLPGIALLAAPQDWQILQRDAQGHGSMRLRLAGDPAPHGPGAAVQARLVEEASGAPVAAHLDWQDAARDGDGWTLRLERIPAGGLYRLETRLRRPGNAGDKRALRGDCRHHLGVGDLWLVAGQSNASGTGKGAANDPPELGLHQFTNAERWTLATHPLEDATGSLHPCTITSIFHGHSPWLAFARRLRARTGLPIGLIPCALGGSPLSLWVRDDGGPAKLTDNLLDMAAKAGDGAPRAAGIVWYQGESDAFDGSGAALAAYPTRFRAWVGLMRHSLGDASLPVVTCQLNCFDGGDAGLQRRWTALREVQRALAHDLPGVALVPTLDTALGDEVHNAAAAEVAIGERCADAALALAYRLPMAAAWPEAVAAAWLGSGRTRLAVTIVNRSGDWTPHRAIGDFAVEDAAGLIPCTGVIIDGTGIEVALVRPAGPGARLHVHAGATPRPALRDDAARCLVGGTLTLADQP